MVRRHIFMVAGGVLFACAAGVVVAVFGVSRSAAVDHPRAEAEIDVASYGRALEERLVETGAGLHARLLTLSELPRLSAAVATDAQTVRDLTDDELAFKAHAGETIALAQLPRRSSARGAAEAAPVLLLLSPAGAPVPPLEPSTGPRVRIENGNVKMSDTVRIAPRARADELDGVIAATWAVDLRDLTDKLAAAGAGAWLTAGGDITALGDPAGVTGGRTVTVAVPRARGATLMVVIPPVAFLSRWVGGLLAGGLAVLGLLSFLLPFWLPSLRQSLLPFWRPAPGARRGRSNPAVVGPVVTAPVLVQAPDVIPVQPRRASSTQRTSRLAPTRRGPGTAPPPPLAGETVTSARVFATPPDSDPVSRWIGRYEIVNLIGTGGMAEVYQARFMGGKLFTRPIALKVLQPPFARQQQVVDHFLEEARLGSLLDHPNIVQILDFGSAHQDYFIAMELIEGADLERLIAMTHQQGHPIPVPVVLAILRGICDGLHAAHSMRAVDGTAMDLVHRDVKSANVFVSKNGVVKVGDFGIARANDAGRLVRGDAGVVRGTPGYMPPEQRLGQSIDRRADLYGVGAIAYELLAGFSVNLDLALLADKGVDGWPHLEPLSSLRADVSARLEAIVMKALAYRAGDRFSDCASLGRALASAAEQETADSGETVAQWIGSTLGLEVEARNAAQAGGRRSERGAPRREAGRQPVPL